MTVIGVMNTSFERRTVIIPHHFLRLLAAPLVCLAAFWAVLTQGCSDSQHDPVRVNALQESVSADPPHDRPRVQPPSTTVSGRVVLKGPVPPSRRIAVNRYGPDAQRLHPSGVLEQPIVVGPDKQVQNVLVYVRSGLENQTFDVPPTEETLTFEGCLLRPPVLGIMIHQRLTVSNKDDFNHTFQISAARNASALSTILPRTSLKHYFTLGEESVLVHCPVHPWEKTRVFVIPHPFFAVTDDAGRYEIRGLPPGRYTLAARQEYCTPQERDCDLKSGEPLSLDLELEAKPH